MLKLSRRSGESLIFQTRDGEVRIHFDTIQGKQARLAINAPQSVRVLRGELKSKCDTSATPKSLWQQLWRR